MCICCLSGLLHSAICILIAHKTAPFYALALAITAVAIALGVLLLLWVQLILFARRHLRHMWVPERAAAAPSEVEDPALRIVGLARRRLLTLNSKPVRIAPHPKPSPAEEARQRSLTRIEQKPYLHRARGAFLAQGSREHESKEPERTERLLANPFALFPPTGQDAFESIAVTALLERDRQGDRQGQMVG